MPNVVNIHLSLPKYYRIVSMGVKSASKPVFVPNPEQMALMPDISGNSLNGLGETEVRRPLPIYWQNPELTPFGPLMEWFYSQIPDDENMHAAYGERKQIMAIEVAPVADRRQEKSAGEWVRLIKEIGLESGGDIIGIATLRPEWVIEPFEVPYETVIMIAVAMDYDALKCAPEIPAAVEVIRQYNRGHKVSRALASWIHRQGWNAIAYGGSGDNLPILLIPPALECGFGELGKHGSVINRDFGSRLRLAAVVTDLPLIPDNKDELNVDDFCLNCKACQNACPTDAIGPSKQMVRGVSKWYVDFDRCLPYFNENMGCAICLAACPWSRPGVAENLIGKIAHKRAREKNSRA